MVGVAGDAEERTAVENVRLEMRLEGSSRVDSERVSSLKQ